MDEDDDGLMPLDSREILEVLGIVFLAILLVVALGGAGWALHDLARAFA